MVTHYLFLKGIPKGCAVKKMEGYASDREAAARSYEQPFPEFIDVLLLSVGQDGHIASLFPGDLALLETTRSVVSIVGPKQPPERLTITPRVIQSTKSTFLFALGEEKGRILAQALEQPDDIASLPVRLVLGSTWVLDSDASEQLNSILKK